MRLVPQSKMLEGGELARLSYCGADQGRTRSGDGGDGEDEAKITVGSMTAVSRLI